MWDELFAELVRDSIYVLRMVGAVICGALIGYEREKRQKNAGIRTHIIVALASSLMMIVSKYGFYDVIGYEGISIDAGRIAAAVVSAVGFIGTGVIFVRRDSTMGLTTSAGLWATVGVGIAIGAGMYVIGFSATILVLIIQAVLHIKRLKVMTHLGGEIKVNLSRENLSAKEVQGRLSAFGIACRSSKIKRGPGGTVFSAQLYFPPGSEGKAVTDALSEAGWVEELSLVTLS